MNLGYLLKRFSDQSVGTTDLGLIQTSLRYRGKYSSSATDEE
jgi:hypothetical protein